MQVHYLSGNPKKKVAKKKNPHVETFSKGDSHKKVSRFELGEISNIDKQIGRLKSTQSKLKSMSAKGKGKAGKIASKKLMSLNSSVESMIRKLEGVKKSAIKGKNEGSKKAHELASQGYKKTSSSFKEIPFNKKYKKTVTKKGKKEEVDISMADRFADSIERKAKALTSGKFSKKLSARMSTQKRSHKAKVASERRAKNLAEKNAMIASLESKLARQKQKEKELKHLMNHGASESDKNELKSLKEELKETLSQLKGVSMAKKKKAKKVAKKAVKSTKKVAKKASKKAKKTTKKASKKVAKKATKKVRKHRRSKKAKVEAVVVKKAKKHSKKAKKTTKRKSKKGKKANPYVVASNPRRKHKRKAKKSNPIMKFASNPVGALSGFGGDIVESLGLKGEALIEVGVVAGVSAVQPLVMNLLRSKVSLIDTFMTKLESLVPAQAVEATPNLLMALVSSAGSALLAKKQPKIAKALDHVARANLMIATVKLAESAGTMITEKSGMAGYVTAPNPRSMGAYVLDRPMGSLPKASTDFQGADFEGVDFGTSTVGGFEGEEEEERPDFGTDVVSIQGLAGEW